MHINAFALTAKSGDTIVPSVVVGEPVPMALGDGYQVVSVHKGNSGETLREHLGVIVGSDPILVARDTRQARAWASLKLEAVPVTIGLGPDIELDERRAWMVKLPPQEWLRASENSVEAFAAFKRGGWATRNIENTKSSVAPRAKARLV